MESPDLPIPVCLCCAQSSPCRECDPTRHSEKKKGHTDDHSHTGQAFLRHAVLAFHEPSRPGLHREAALQYIARLQLRDKTDELSQTTIRTNAPWRDSCAASIPGRLRADASL